MDTSNQNEPNKFIHWLKNSITARMLMVGFLVIILLIPLAYIQDLIEERSFRQQDVVREINDKWGESVMVYGPILKLPYKTYSETKNYNEATKTYITETKTKIKYAYIFPEELDGEVSIDSKTLKRNNFESAVYSSKLKLKGNFIKADLSNKGILEEDIVWEESTVLIKTTNLKGIKGEVDFKFNGNDYEFQTNFNSNRLNSKNDLIRDSYTPGLDELESNFIKSADIPNDTSKSFSLNMNFDGSTQFQIIPIGKTTSLKMKSDWPDPSFIGNFLPNDETKTIENDGFSVDWKVTHLNRAFSQQNVNVLPNLSDFAFGTKLVVMVDEYQKSERSAKYGFLVIALTFLIFFLIQTLSKIPIHPFQYLMIGLALTMFYTLLVSISEHSNFLKAYLIAGISVVSLITLYSKSILKNWRFPIFIGLSLTALYSFIYVIIQLENYALLVGSIGIFLILAAVMYVSRRIDWQQA